MKKVLVTCPPMLRVMTELTELCQSRGWDVTCPDVVQTLSEEALMDLLPAFDGWIIGDDPATARVFQAGRAGALRAAVKWGVGVDNVDFEAAKALEIPITNTPGMFGREVADLAMSYVTALARGTFEIDRGVRSGLWPKPTGVSLADKTVGLVGFGDIGRNVARRLLAADMRVVVYDPFYQACPELKVAHRVWPEGFEDWDFLVLTCALTNDNRHMVNASVLSERTRPLRVVNVARGPLIDEPALEAALSSGSVHSAALDVFEEEPLPVASVLRTFPRCIFGSHNASNTLEAVIRTSERAIDCLDRFLDGASPQ